MFSFLPYRSNYYWNRYFKRIFFPGALFVLSALPITQAVAQDSTPVLTISQAVQLSLDHNRELAATRFDAKAAIHSKSEAYSVYWPQISFSHTTQKIESDRFSIDIPPGSPFEGLFDPKQFGFSGANFTNFVNVTQLIFDRSVIGRIRLTELQSEAAHWQENGQEQVAVFNTVAAYLDVLRAQELLSVQKQRLELAEKQLKTAQTKFEVGLRIRTDVLRAELTRSSALRDVVSAEIALRNAQVRLNRVMGQPIDRVYQFEGGELASYNPTRESLGNTQDYSRLFAMAQDHHPSIKVASLLVDQSDESVKIARGEFAPRVSAGGGYGFNESGSIRLQDEEWRFLFQVEIPIFEGGRKIAKISRTKAERDAQKKRYEDTVLTISTLVEQSALALQEEQRNLEIALEAETVAEENHTRFLNIYEEGLADSLDVTQALTELVEAQTNVVTTRYGYLRLYAQLLNAIGVIPTGPSEYSSMDWLMTLQ